MTATPNTAALQAVYDLMCIYAALFAVCSPALFIMWAVGSWERADNARIQVRMDRRGEAMGKAFDAMAGGKITEDEFNTIYKQAKATP